MKDHDSSAPWLDQDEPWSAELREALRMADQEDGTPEQVARLEARLAPLLGGTDLAAPRARETGPSALGSGGFKALTAVLALVGAGALVWPQREHAQRSLPPLDPSASEYARAERLGAHTPYVVLAPEAESVALEEQAERRSLSPTLSRRERGQDETLSRREGERDEALSRRGREQDETLSPREGEQGAAPSQKDMGLRSQEEQESAVRADARGDHDLAREARLLQRARRALGRRAAEALHITEQHRLRYAQGLLVEEREAIAIKALRQLGQTAAADARQAHFAKRFPESPHLASLRSAAVTPPGE